MTSKQVKVNYDVLMRAASMISLESRVVSEKSKLKVKPTFYITSNEIRIQHSQHWAELI